MWTSAAAFEVVDLIGVGGLPFMSVHALDGRPGTAEGLVNGLAW
jgi:hypothetical protein